VLAIHDPLTVSTCREVVKAMLLSRPPATFGRPFFSIIIGLARAEQGGPCTSFAAFCYSVNVVGSFQFFIVEELIVGKGNNSQKSDKKDKKPKQDKKKGTKPANKK
jgi:fructose-1,6-bisphosphatase/inositol monophosphatase family enzyme